MLIPKTLTLIFILVAILFAALLLWAAWRHRNPQASAPADEDLSRFGAVATNRWLRGLRGFLALFVLTVIAFHAYWVFRADHDEAFARAKRNDARLRRFAESGLKGWVLDRSGKLENALIRYRADAGVISREYPLAAAAVHLTGYSDFISGAGGFEYALRDWLTQPVSVINQLQSPTPVGKDLRVSVDINLQREAFNLLQATGKPAAAVVLALPSNEVLAMASAPSFDPAVLRNAKEWQRLTAEAEDAQLISPLVNRALGTLVTGGAAFYYRPGSTFKTFVAAVAIDTGVTQEKFTCKADGFVATGVSRPIRDYGGEVHGTIGLADAFKHSCNQYFVQLGLRLGRERLANYAKRLGFATAPADNRRRAQDLWLSEHGARDDFNFIFAPPIQRLNLSADATEYDIAQQAIGQGYADLTVMSMAVLAATAASPDGAFVAPTFEVGAARKVAGEFIKPASAAQLRALMRSVTQAGGTAAGVFRNLTAGGKTGTADRVVLVYRDGKPVVESVDEEGKPRYRYVGWTDSWFIGYAPADNPQIAFAVVVENGGQGARNAAPIAAKLADKAAALGLITTKSAQPDGLPARPR